MTVQAHQLRVATKNPCRLASTASVNIGTGGLVSVDGVIPVAGDRILLKDQGSPEDNGIYIAGAGAWSRSLDMDSVDDDHVTAGLNSYISEGTVSAKKTYVLTTTGTIILGTTSLTFEEGPTAGGGGGSTAVTQTNAVFVSKAGNNSDTGLTKDDPKLTIAAALTVASGLTPSTTNRISLVIQDAGIYNEYLTLPDYVSLFGPDATITNTFGALDHLGSDCSVHVHKLVGTGSYTAVEVATAGERWITADIIENTGTTQGILVNHADAVVHLNVGAIKTVTGAGILAYRGTLDGFIGEMEATGHGWNIYSDIFASTMDLHVGTMTSGDVNVYTSGPSDQIRVFVGYATATNTRFHVHDATATLSVFLAEDSGDTDIETGTLNLTVAGSSGGSTAATQTNAVFVSKAGDDGDTGLTLDAPKLTIGSAVTAASALTPGAANRIEIYIQDAGIYADSVVLPDYVSLIGPTATIDSAVPLTMGIESTAHLHHIDGAVDAVRFGKAGKCWIKADLITGGDGVNTTSASAEIHLDVGRIVVSSGVAVYATNGTAGWIVGTIDEIYISGSGYGLWAYDAGRFDLTIGRMHDAGTSTRGITLDEAGGLANLVIGELNVVSPHKVDTGATLNMFVGSLTGTSATTTGTANITEAGVAPGVTQTNVVYVSKGGDNSNTGLGPAFPKLTLAAAITAASGLTPTTTNRVTILIQDGGIYTESGLALDDYVSLVGPGATITSPVDMVTVGEESTVQIHRILGTGTGAVKPVIIPAGVTECWITADEISTTSTSGSAAAIYGLSVTAGVRVHLNVKKIATNVGRGIWVDLGSADMHLDGYIGEMEITGAGDAFFIEGTSTLDLTVEKIYDAGTGFGVKLNNTSSANLRVGELNCNDNWQVNTGTTLNLFVNTLSGIGSIETGSVNFTESGVAIGMRAPCRMTTAANIADLAAGAPNSVDGVTPVVGNRILVMEQTTASQNGVYVVDTVGSGVNGVWSRAVDFTAAKSNDISAGLTYYIQEGSTNSGSFQTLTTTGTITIGSTSLTFENKTGGGAGSVGGSTGATDDALLLADGTGGATLKSSGVTLADIRGPVKMPCRVATTADVADTTTGAPDTVDGVSLAVNDRILVWKQDDLDADLENGIYSVTTVGTGSDGVWARATDWDEGAADYLTAGNTTYVQEGDLWARTTFTLVTTGTITVATTATEFIPEGGLARSDASSTEIIASTAFTAGTFVVNDSGFTNMRDHSEIAIFVLPVTLGTNVSVDVVVFWSDDGTTIPFALDDNIQQTDFDIVSQSDGTYNPKPYTARLTTAGGELVAGQGFHMVVPKGGGACKVGVKGTAADGSFTVRVQRLVN